MELSKSPRSSIPQCVLLRNSRSISLVKENKYCFLSPIFNTSYVRVENSSDLTLGYPRDGLSNLKPPSLVLLSGPQGLVMRSTITSYLPDPALTPRCRQLATGFNIDDFIELAVTILIDLDLNPIARVVDDVDPGGQYRLDSASLTLLAGKSRHVKSKAFHSMILICLCALDCIYNLVIKFGPEESDGLTGTTTVQQLFRLALLNALAAIHSHQADWGLGVAEQFVGT